MSETRWVWEQGTRRYRDTTTGRFLSGNAARALRDEFIAYQSGETNAFITELLAGTGAAPLSPEAWQGVVAQIDPIGWRGVETTMIAEYAQGLGGLNALTTADRTALSGLLTEQRAYWDGFVAEMADGTVTSAAGIARRVNYYHQAGRGFQARAMARSWAIELPAYPGEQACGPNCRCGWEITTDDGVVEATWILSAVGDSCTDCEDNSLLYAPYRIEDEGASA